MCKKSFGMTRFAKHPDDRQVMGVDLGVLGWGGFSMDAVGTMVLPCKMDACHFDAMLELSFSS